MKKIIIITAILSLCFSLRADNIRVSVCSLPKTSSQFAKSTFKDKQIASIKEDKTFLDLIGQGYEVVYKDGSYIKFSDDGIWEEISAPNSALPDDVIPERILLYVKENFKNIPITKIEKDDDGFEIKLKNNQKLKFNGNYIFVDIDD